METGVRNCGAASVGVLQDNLVLLTESFDIVNWPP